MSNAAPLLLAEEFVAYYPSLGKALGSVEHAVIVQHLWFRRDRATGKTEMTAATLADEIGMAPRTCERALSKLRARGVLSRERLSRSDSTSVWTVHTDVLEQIRLGNVETAGTADVAVPGPQDENPGTADVAVPETADVAVPETADVAVPTTRKNVKRGGENGPSPQPAFPDQCAAHQDGPNDTPCHGCRRAREACEAAAAEAARQRAANPMVRCDHHGTMYAAAGYCGSCSSEHKADRDAHPTPVPQCSRCAAS